MQNQVPLDVRAFHPRLALRTSTPLPGKSADVSDEAVLLQVSLRRETERVMLSPKQNYAAQFGTFQHQQLFYSFCLNPLSFLRFFKFSSKLST